MIMSCMIHFCFSGNFSQKIVLPIISIHTKNTFFLIISCLPRSEFKVLQINTNANSETLGLVSVQACLSPQGFII